MSSLPAERVPRAEPSRAAQGQPFCSSAGGLALLALSAGVLAYELLLLRLFSVLMWYHFASLTIGVALLGLSAGAVWVGLVRRPGPGLVRWGAAGFGVGVLGFLAGLVAVHFSPRLAAWALAPFHQPFFQPFARTLAALPDSGIGWRVAALAGAAGLPFLGAGVALAAALSAGRGRIHRTYAWILGGSGIGAAAVPAALTVWSAPAALAAVASLAFAAAAGRRRAPLGTILMLLAGCALAWGLDVTGAAELPLARGRYEPGLLAVRWNPMSRVAAYPLAPGGAARPFGLSPRYRGPHPQQLGLVVDDSGYTNLYEGDAARANPDYFRQNLVALAWHLRPGARTLIVGPGGGKDVWVALSFPGTRVQAVEINPGVVEMVEEVFAGFTGRPYSDARVRLAVADARAFTARDPARYDVIEASAVFGRMPPAAGVFTLSEDFLHTREALEAYWRRLSPDGILSITLFAHERRAPRLVALVRDLLDRQGVAGPQAHVRVVGDRAVANVLVSRRPFTPQEDRSLRERVKAARFRMLYPPEGGDNLLARILEAPELSSALDRLPYDLSPPTDDRPFFYYTLRLQDFLQPGSRAVGFDNQGVLLLRSAFLVLALLTLVGLVAPVALRHALPRGGGPALAYAAAIGLGYMLVEIGILKRLVLFLAHPVYAAAAVLAAFLCGSGLGSLLAPRIAPNPRRLAAVLLVVAAGVWAWALLAPGWFRPDHPWGLVGRAAVAVAALAPLAFLMGIPFPSGMALLGRTAGASLPWCWALNGAAGILGSVGALLVALHFGYTGTLVAGAAVYASAAILVPRLGGGR